MTITLNSQEPPCTCNDNDTNTCEIAQTTLCPDCFKLSITYDPSIPAYSLTLCNYVVVFTNVCCLDYYHKIVLRIPITFSQDGSLYRVGIAPVNIVLNNGLTIPITPVSDGSFINFVIRPTALAFSQNGNSQCIVSLTFASFNLPLTKIPGFCFCPSLCPSVQWTYGIPFGGPFP